MKIRNNKTVAIAAMSIILSTSLLFTGCASVGVSNNAKAAQSVEAKASSVMTVADSQESGKVAEAVGGAPASQKPPLANQKIIERLSYRMETLEFDKSVQTMQSLTEELGGYVQESGIDGDGALQKNDSRTAHYVLRIPQEKLKLWKERAATIGAVLNVSSTSENITESYYDTEAHLKALQTQRDRLLELMKKADKMADIVELEKALADVTYQMDQLTGTLRQYDSLINYSTVTVELFEVSKATIIDKTPVTLGEKISHQFQLSLRWMAEAGQGAIIVLLGGLPIILLAVVLGAVLGLVLRRRRKKHAVPVASIKGEEVPDDTDVFDNNTPPQE